MKKYIEQAIENFRRSSARYAKTERYYRGEHDLAFATEKFQNTFGTLFREFAMNLCPAICDAVRDKLKITGFGLGTQAAPLLPEEGWPKAGAVGAPARAAASASHASQNEALRVGSLRSDDLHSAISRIWHRNRMPQRAGELHKEALKNGDAYAVVWFDPAGEVTIYPHRAANVTVAYDEDTPGHILSAAKYWRTPDKRTRLNVFYPDRIERYITKMGSENYLPDANDFVPFAGNAGDSPAPSSKHDGGITPLAAMHATRVRSGHIVSNPFGVVPVFHFANNADVGCLGQSELTQAMPVQDGLNKSILDMLVAMEFSAYRQRWASGIEIEYDDDGNPKPPFTSGADRVWIASDPNTTFGDFNTSNLDQFIKVKDSFRIDMASVTGTPLHYFLQNSRGFASGESLKQNETRFLAKVRDRQVSFGQTWAELMSFALRLAGYGPGIELITNWEDPAPHDEKDVLVNILRRKQIGISTEQALKEAGYGEVEARRMLRKPAQK
jgi:hypothetical protein